MKKIRLTKGYFALVDDEDFEELSKFNWHYFKASVHTTGYAMRHGLKREGLRGKHIYMHRAIMNPEPGMEVDHRDGDTLDNRRSNLRVTTHAQNRLNNKTQANNTSGFRGVSWNKSVQKWNAHIRFRGSQTNIGDFRHLADAIGARVSAEIELFGEFAPPIEEIL